jgi:beta-lactamase regulating signal transducer with metallopeptidase domain
MTSDFIPIAMAQLWQVTLLILVVAALSRWLSPRRPHLSHLLWMVVLIKCVTPPLWASPGGVFCWLQPEQKIETPFVENIEWTPVAWDRMLDVKNALTIDSELSAAPFAGVYFDETADAELTTASSFVEPPSDESVGNATVVAWAVISGLVLLVVTIRWLRFWRLVRASPRRNSPELDTLLKTLSKQLGVRRRVRLIVTESLVGPAVVGFFRVTVLIPAIVADKLKGESVAPILAHELLHIRRGDLWVGLLQTVAQALWWFHPLVWWVGRVTTREAERCCDEEVLGELKCDPASYARALLDVLDLKSQLKPVPVFPGVRPVDVTTQRLERIMSLRQGCRRRSPWWCWLVAIGAAALTLPGAAFEVTAQQDEPRDLTGNEDSKTFPAPPAYVGPGPFPPMPLPRDTELTAYSIGASNDAPRTEVYDITEFMPLLSGSESEKQQKFERLVRSRTAAREAQINWFNGRPVVKTNAAGQAAVRQCINVFVGSGASSETIDEFLKSVSRQLEATLVCEILVISVSDNAYSKLEDVAINSSGETPWVIPSDTWEEAVKSIDRDETFHFLSPECAVFNGRSVMVESIAEHPVSLKREADGRLVPGVNWSGWKTRLLPFVRSDGSFWLGLSFENGKVVGRKPLSAEQAEQINAEGPVTVHSYRQVKFSTTLKEGQVVVLPGFETAHGHDAPRATLMSVHVRRLANAPGANAVSSPRPVGGAAANTDAGVDGEIVLHPNPTSITPRTVPEIQPTSAQRDEGNDEARTSGGKLLTRRFLGSLRLTIRRQGDGSISPRMMVTLANAEGNNVLTGTADEVEIKETKLTQSVELTNAKLRAVGVPQQRFAARQLRLIHNHGAADKTELRMELKEAEVQFESNGQTSKLMAEGIDLKLRAESFVVEEVQANGLGSLKTDSPVEPEKPATSSPEPLQSNLPNRHRAISAREQTEKMLGQRVEVSFPGTSLKEVVRSLARTSSLNIILDARALEEEGLTGDEPVSIEVSGIKLRSALNLILEPLKLVTKVDDEDGVIIITSRDRAAGRLVAMAYPVADLVISVPAKVQVGSPRSDSLPKGKSAGTRGGPQTEAESSTWRVATPLPVTTRSTDFNFKELTGLIQQTVEPDSWSKVGGQGTIHSSERTLSLVIRQTEDIHGEISELLGQLRRLREVQVDLQMHMLNVPESFLADWNLDLMFKPLAESKSHRYARLSSAQADRIRNVTKSSQILKVTLFNGQLCEWYLDKRDGTQQSWHVQPVVSADRRHIRLGLGIDDGQTEPAAHAVPTSVTTISDKGAILVEIHDSPDTVSPIVGVPVPGQPRTFRRVSLSRRFVLIQSEVLVNEDAVILPDTDAGQ